jgi:hypothetical protein
MRILLAALISLMACSGPAVAQPTPLTGVSRAYDVKGQTQTLALDRVERVALQKGQIVFHGSLLSVTVDPPASADITKPTRYWALTTEGSGDGKRSVTFTHAELVEDFTLELPAAEGEIRYGVFEGPGGAEVMVLAWGSYWGHVTIRKR